MEQERRPAAEPAAEQCAACAPPCCWAMSHPAPGRVPAALQCATDCWAGAAAMVHARMVLFQRFSWGCCAGPPLESYEVVDDDVERAILRLSWDGCHCDVTPSLWVTWGRRMHAAAEAAHDGVLDLCPLVSWLSTFCRRLAWKSPANKENDKQRNNNWSLMQHANRSRCVIQQARHHRWSRMDDWAAMLDFPAEIQSNKLNFAFTIGNFTKGMNPHWTTIRSNLKNSLEQSSLDQNRPSNQIWLEINRSFWDLPCDETWTSYSVFHHFDFLEERD